MLVAPIADPLIRMPLGTAEAHRDTYHVAAVLAADGTITGTCRLESTGTKTDRWRALARQSGSSEFQKSVVGQLRDTMRDVHVAGLQWSDDPEKEGFSLQFEFGAPRYARSVGGRLLIFQPALLQRRDWLPPDEERQSALPFPVGSRRERFEVQLAEGFVVDEQPEPVTIDRPYVRYHREAS